MPQGTKIATCCYCGTRAALVLRGRDRHELSCAACGAPLHNMKMLRMDAVERPVSSERHASNRPVKRSTERAASVPSWERSMRKPTGKKKKRKTLTRRFFEEAFDVLEDIFD